MFFIVIALVLSLLWQLKESFHRLIMGKVDIGIYFCVTADVLKKKFYRNVFVVAIYQPYDFVQIADSDWLPWQPKTKFLKKCSKILLLRSHKGDEAKTLHECSWH